MAKGNESVLGISQMILSSYPSENRRDLSVCCRITEPNQEGARQGDYLVWRVKHAHLVRATGAQKSVAGEMSIYFI